MLESIEKTVLTAIGAAILTHKKAEEIVSELIEKCMMTENEGKLLVNHIQEILNDSQLQMRRIAEVEIQNIINSLGLVTREEFDCLLKRVHALEKRKNGNC